MFVNSPENFLVYNEEGSHGFYKLVDIDELFLGNESKRVDENIERSRLSSESFEDNRTLEEIKEFTRSIASEEKLNYIIKEDRETLDDIENRSSEEESLNLGDEINIDGEESNEAEDEYRNFEDLSPIKILNIDSIDICENEFRKGMDNTKKECDRTYRRLLGQIKSNQEESEKLRREYSNLMKKNNEIMRRLNRLVESEKCKKHLKGNSKRNQNLDDDDDDDKCSISNKIEDQDRIENVSEIENKDRVDNASEIEDQNRAENVSEVEDQDRVENPKEEDFNADSIRDKYKKIEGKYEYLQKLNKNNKDKEKDRDKDKDKDNKDKKHLNEMVDPKEKMDCNVKMDKYLNYYDEEKNIDKWKQYDKCKGCDKWNEYMKELDGSKDFEAEENMKKGCAKDKKEKHSSKHKESKKKSSSKKGSSKDKCEKKEHSHKKKK